MSKQTTDIIDEIIEYAIENSNDPTTALVDYFEERGSLVPITYQQAREIIESRSKHAEENNQ